MATHRMPTARRSFRPGKRSLIAALVGAGVVLSPLPALASPAAPTAASAQAGRIVAHSHAAQIVVNTAMAQLGKPYVWAGAGPSSFDCSGLTQYAFKAAGVSLPRTTGAQATAGIPVSRASLVAGDLVFFYGNSHVGVALGNGLMVHAPTPGDVVKITRIDYMGQLSAAGRVV
jgi:cell wall-associated NlpC family hydrolase